MNVKDRSNWTNKNIEYLKNVNITEYDLASGGLSVIKEYKLLDEKYIKNLDEMEKEKKNIIIGKLQAKLPNLAKNMVVCFGKARQLFIDNNSIADDEILSIKKDALFIINKRGLRLDGKLSSNLNFRPKNNYSSYIRLNNKEFYYSSLIKESDIKGISEETKESQKDYLIKDINRFLNQSEKIQKEYLYQNLKQYRSDYLNRKLPIETYRNLDTGMFSVDDFELQTVDVSYIDQIDISYNFVFYIRPLIQLLLDN